MIPPHLNEELISKFHHPHKRRYRQLPYVRSTNLIPGLQEIKPNAGMPALKRIAEFNSVDIHFKFPMEKKPHVIEKALSCPFSLVVYLFKIISHLQLRRELVPLDPAEQP